MDNIAYFTWGEFIYNEAFNLLSCISMALCIIIIALVKNCFLGGRLNISKKAIYRTFSIIPMYLIYFLILFFYTINKNDWDFNKTIEVDLEGDIWKDLIKVLVFIVCVFICFELYEKHCFLHAVGYYISIILFEFYFEGLILYSMVYSSDDKFGVLGSFVYPEPGDHNLYVYKLCYFIILIALFLVLYYGYYRKHKYIYISWGYRIAFFVWVLIIGILPLFPMAKDTEIEMYRLLGYGVAFIIPVLVIGVPIFMVSIVSKRIAVEKVELQEEYINYELEYINQYKKSQNETRAFRHDISNNLSLLSMLMENGKSDEAKAHLSNLLGEINSLSPKYSTGDEMLDCIVSMKASKMEENGIEFDIDGVVDGGLKMTPSETCSLFANALDNAIEACRKMPKKDHKKIRMIIRRTDSFFNIRIENTFDSGSIKINESLIENGERFTTKKNKNLHGYGIRNMKQIVSKYAGMIKDEIEDGLFKLSIMIPR